MNVLQYFPNFLSLLRIVLTPLVVVLLCMCCSAYVIASVVIFTLAVITDFYDGYFARKYAIISRAGNFLDPLADKLLVLSTFTAFWYLALLPLWMLLIIALREVAVTGLRFGMEYCGKSMVTSYFGKWKTVLQFIAIYTLFLVRLKVAFVVPELVSSILYGVVGITAFSGFHYFYTNTCVSKCSDVSK